MRLRDTRIGALNLFADRPLGLSAPDRALGQAMADVASIGIMQERLVRQKDLVTDQLQTALNSRIIIEQAKGVLAQQAQLDMDGAFALLRCYARHNQQRLGDVATSVIEPRLHAVGLRRSDR